MGGHVVKSVSFRDTSVGVFNVFNPVKSDRGSTRGMAFQRWALLPGKLMAGSDAADARMCSVRLMDCMQLASWMATTVRIAGLDAWRAGQAIWVILLLCMPAQREQVAQAHVHSHHGYYLDTLTPEGLLVDRKLNSARLEGRCAEGVHAERWRVSALAWFGCADDPATCAGWRRRIRFMPMPMLVSTHGHWFTSASVWMHRCIDDVWISTHMHPRICHAS
jgi:hypothetical protein